MARTSLVLWFIIVIATVVQVVLGLYVWWSSNVAWLPVHLALGLLIITAMWLVTLLASRAQVGFGRCIAIIALTLLLPIFGMAQMFVSAGPGNWVLMALHMIAAGTAISMSLRVARLAQVRFTQGGVPTADPASRSFGHAHA